MILLTLEEQKSFLGVEYTNKSGWVNLSKIYQRILKTVYPKSENLISRWSYFARINGGTPLRESYCIVREMDQKLFHDMYFRLFNPVFIVVNKEFNEFYLHLIIESIDDSCFKYEFTCNNEFELDQLKESILSWIDKNPVMEKNILTNFCLSYKGVNKSY